MLFLRVGASGCSIGSAPSLRRLAVHCFGAAAFTRRYVPLRAVHAPGYR